MELQPSRRVSRRAFLSHHVTHCPATRSSPTMHCDEVTEFLVRQKKKERMFSPTWRWLDGTEGLCFKVTAKILARTAQKSWHLESRNGSAWWRSLWNASDFCLRQPEHCPAAGANALSISNEWQRRCCAACEQHGAESPPNHQNHQSSI